MPVSRLPELVHETKKDMAQEGITSTIVGHVGDGMSPFHPFSSCTFLIGMLIIVPPFWRPGNFHALMLFKDDKELEKVSAAVHRLAHRAIALDGTCKSSSPSMSTVAAPWFLLLSSY